MCRCRIFLPKPMRNEKYTLLPSIMSGTADGLVPLPCAGACINSKRGDGQGKRERRMK
jgi:hypothetical protein